MSDKSEGGNLDQAAFPWGGRQCATLQFLTATVVLNKAELPQHLAEMVFSGKQATEEYLSRISEDACPALFKTVTTALTPPAP